MARAASSDPYLSFRYHLSDPAGGNLDPVAGFMSVTTPEISVEVAPYREGVMRWTQKYPGVQSVSEIQLVKGTFRRESDFFSWVLRIVNGGVAEYRTDVQIAEFHITDEFGINGAPSRIMRCREVWPSGTKPMSDKDANASEVSTQSLVMQIEEFDIEIVPTAA